MSKVTVVGCGAVGVSIATNLIIQGLCSELVIYDLDKDKLKGEVYDMQHGGNFHSTRVIAAESWTDTFNSQLCIITAGVRQKPNESRLNLLHRNVLVMKSIVPDFVKYSPDSVLMVVSNPCDIMTRVVHSLSGFPEYRVFGSGTFLDTSRLRSVIGYKLHINPSRVHVNIIGEHGDSSVPCFSTGIIGGKKVTDWLNKKELDEMHVDVVKAAYNVIQLKGCTNSAIGFASAQIAKGVLYDKKYIIPLSVNIKGHYGIDHDCFLSLPCVIGKRGIDRIIDIDLDEEEVMKLHKSAENVDVDLEEVL